MSSKDFDMISSQFETAVAMKSIPETLRAIAHIGQKKCRAPMDTVIIKGFLAGVFIGFGAYLSLVTGGNIAAYKDGYLGLIRLIMGAVAPLGMILVVYCGGDLFTANTLIIPISLYFRKVKFFEMCKVYFLCYVGNFVGALFAVLCFAYLSTDTTDVSNSVWFETAISIAEKKMTGTWYGLILSGIAANMLIALSFYIGARSKNSVGKLLGIWLPIFAYVAMDYEHCVANCFHIPLGLLLGASQWYYFIYNICLVTLGNVIGGSFFVASLVYYNFKRSTDWKDKCTEWFEVIKKGKFPSLKKKKTDVNNEEELKEPLPPGDTDYSQASSSSSQQSGSDSGEGMSASSQSSETEQTTESGEESSEDEGLTDILNKYERV